MATDLRASASLIIAVWSPKVKLRLTEYTILTADMSALKKSFNYSERKYAEFLLEHFEGRFSGKIESV